MNGGLARVQWSALPQSPLPMRALTRLETLGLVYLISACLPCWCRSLVSSLTPTLRATTP